MNVAERIATEESEVSAGDIVQVARDVSEHAWRGAIGSVERVFYAHGRASMEPVATVCVDDLGTSTFPTRLLRRIEEP